MSFGGNGGNGSIHTDSDVALNNPSDGQLLGYNASLQKWQNQTAGFVTQVAAPSGDTSGATDQAIIQAALSAAAIAGGGIVTLRAGTYFVTGLGISARVFLQGAGKYATTMKLANSQNVDLLQTTNFSSNTPQSSIGILNMTLDANGGQQTAGYVVSLYGAASLVDNVIFQNGHDGGVRSAFSGSAYPLESMWSNFHIANCGGISLAWQGPHDSQFTNGVIYLTSSPAVTPTFGIRLYGNAGGELFTNVHAWGGWSGFSWYMEKVCYATNCYAEGAAVGQVMLGYQGSSWKGYVQGNGHTTTRGIQVGDDNAWGGGASHTTVNECSFDITLDNFGGGSYPVYFPTNGSGGGNRYTAVARLGGRTDGGCGLTGASAIVTDALATNADVGAYVSGPGIPYGTTIMSVSSGVGFTMSNNANVTAASVPLMIGGSGVILSTASPNSIDDFDITCADNSWLSFHQEVGPSSAAAYVVSSTLGRRFMTPVLIRSGATTALRIQDGTSNDILYVNSKAKDVELQNNTALRGFTDVGTTKTIEINPATGAIQPGNTNGNTPALGGRIFSGAGVPNFSATTGDAYFRTDTPTVANQRLYTCTSTGNNWSGIL